MGKIIHGNRNFGYATINTTSTPKFDTPKMLPGLVSTSIEVEQSDTKVPADNIVYCIVKGAKVRTATAAFRYIPEAYAELLGFKKETNGMLVDTGTFASHCIFFETTEEDSDTNQVTQTLHYLYNVVASEPTHDSNTDEEEVEAAEIEINYSASASSIATDAQKNGVQYAYITRTEQNKNLYDQFKTKVILPTEAIGG